MDSERSENYINRHFIVPENNDVANSVPMNNNLDVIENDNSIAQGVEENIVANPSHDIKEYNESGHFYHRPNSLRLESVLEYTSKIKAFLGLEEESLVPEVNGDTNENPNTNKKTEQTLDKPNLNVKDDSTVPEMVNEQAPLEQMTNTDTDNDDSLKIISQIPDDSKERQEQHIQDWTDRQLPAILDTNSDLPEVISDLGSAAVPESSNAGITEKKENIEKQFDNLFENFDSEQNCVPDTFRTNNSDSNTSRKDNEFPYEKSISSDLENAHEKNTELGEMKKEDTAEESDDVSPLTDSECQNVKDKKKYDLEQLANSDKQSVGEGVDFSNAPNENNSELISLKENAEIENESNVGGVISKDKEDNKTMQEEEDSGKACDLIIGMDIETDDNLMAEKSYQIMDIVQGLKNIEKNSNITNNNTIIETPDQTLQVENEENVNNLSESCKTNNDKNVPNMEDLRRLSNEVVNSVLQSAGDQMNVILDEENSDVSYKESMELTPCEVENNSLQCSNETQECLENNSDSKLDGACSDIKDNICLPQEILPEFSTLNSQSPTENEDISNKIPTERTKQRKIEMKNLSASVESIVVCTVTSSCEIDPNTQCGIGAFKPQCIQKYATARIYLVLYSILGILHGSYYTYLVGVLSTLEKRFEFKSKTSGSIMMLDELTPLFLGVLVGHFGGRAHRPRLLSFGMFLSAFCCFASALPYFMYGPATHLSSTSVHNVTGPEMCNKETRMDYCDSDDRPPTLTAITLLMLGSFLKGFGNLAYYAIGLAYLDDNAKKKNSPLYFAVAFALRLLGPMVGYLMSSAFLKYYESPFDDPGFGPDDPRWIGGWWMGFMLQGILLLIFAGPIALFPRRLPGHMSVVQEMELKTKPFFEGLGDALKRLAKNPLFVLITINAILTIYGNFGYYIMVPKYMENQFHFSASTASLFAGPPGIAAVMLSTILGGYLIWKFKPSAKFLAAGLVTVEIISTTGYLLLMIPQCETTELANFGFGEESLILEDTCNMNCNCSTVSFNPICGPDGKTAYFSPCYAGCSYQKNQSYFNCSCTKDYSEEAIATKGFCSVDCWSKALTYIIMLPVFQFTCNTVRVAFTIILLRSINPEDKNIALGVFETVISTLAFIPFPILFGALVDSACLVWEKSCGESGNCWFYDMKKFNYLLHGTSAAFCGLAVMCLTAIFCFIDKIQDLYDDFDGKPQHTEPSVEEKNKETSVVIKI